VTLGPEALAYTFVSLNARLESYDEEEKYLITQPGSRVEDAEHRHEAVGCACLTVERLGLRV